MFNIEDIHSMSSSINGFHITYSPNFWVVLDHFGPMKLSLLEISWRKENLKCFLSILSSCINYNLLYCSAISVD